MRTEITKRSRLTEESINRIDFHDGALIAVSYHDSFACLTMVFHPNIWDDYPERPRAVEFHQVRDLRLTEYSDVSDYKDNAMINWVTCEKVGDLLAFEFFLYVTVQDDDPSALGFSSLEFVCTEAIGLF